MKTNQLAMVLLIAVFISSACSSAEVSNGNGSNSTTSTNSNVNPATSSPSPTSQIESFTAESLLKSFNENLEELNNRIESKEISISGPVKVTDQANFEFPGKDGEVVRCGLSSGEDRAVLVKLSQQAAKGGNLPVTTAIGTYERNKLGEFARPKFIRLRNCRIVETGK